MVFMAVHAAWQQAHDVHRTLVANSNVDCVNQDAVVKEIAIGNRFTDTGKILINQ